MTHRKSSSLVVHIGLLLTVALSLAIPASAEWKEKVLYSFQGGTDGSTPVGGVIFDSAGNVYGATQDGGSASCRSIYECGTVYQLAPPATKGDAWTETVLYVFQGNAKNDGASPFGGLVMDSSGNLYGTTAYGGTGDCVLLGSKLGCGSVFELSPPTRKGGAWTERILYSFPNSKRGYVPWGNLVFDKSGNLYGSTIYGGDGGTTCDLFYGGQCGVVFELSPPKQKGGKWTEKVLHGFASGTDGANPNGGLVLDGKGNVYGTTYMGGDQSGECAGGGCGTAFELEPPTKTGGAWKEKVIHRFQGGQDGDNPWAGLVFGENGDPYGTTLTGGANGGGGTVFRLTPPSNGSEAWKKVILYGFNGTGGGLDVESPVVFDPKGNLYGATLDSGGNYYGTVYRLRPPKEKADTWTFNMLYGFQAPPDGGQPAAGLVFDKSGNLYGTTTQGGSGAGCGFQGCGTVFQVSP
jgi:hypothetical protein